MTKIQYIILEDHRLKEKINISLGSVRHILSEPLDFQKPCAQGVFDSTKHSNAFCSTTFMNMYEPGPESPKSQNEFVFKNQQKKS